MEQIITALSQIYNTLSTIDTHGDETLKMAACLNALAQVINTLTPPDPAEPIVESEGE